jgi:hypothetical protein
MQWFLTSENVPEEGRLVLTYSEPFGSYDIGKWSSSRGWLDGFGHKYKIITHWCDVELPLPFEATFSYSEELAAKYGVEEKSRHSPFE